MIFDMNSEAFVGGVERRSLGHGPRLQRPIDRQPEIVVQPRCPVLLNHERVAMLGPGTDFQLWQFRLWQACALGGRGGLVQDLSGGGFGPAGRPGSSFKPAFPWEFS